MHQSFPQMALISCAISISTKRNNAGILGKPKIVSIGCQAEFD